MQPLTQLEYDSMPSYLTTQLCLPLERLNEAIEVVNVCVTDKRFEGGGVNDHVTAEELNGLLRLGARSKTFILAMLQCGRLRGLDASQTTADKRYKIASAR